jgi:hypothetical protein
VADPGLFTHLWPQRRTFSGRFYGVRLTGHSPDTGGFEARMALLIGLSNGKSSSPHTKDNQSGG